MERALRNINVVAATPSKTDSGYPRLTNHQLAEEVQKFAGYNHLSSSAANLFEEVTRRLVSSASQYNPRTQPLGLPADHPEVFDPRGGRGNIPDPAAFPSALPGFTITDELAKMAHAVVRINVHEVLPKHRYYAIRDELLKSGAAKDLLEANGLISEFKEIYNLTSIINQGKSLAKVLEIYWVKWDDTAPAGKPTVFWCWAPESQIPVESTEVLPAVFKPGFIVTAATVEKARAWVRVEVSKLRDNNRLARIEEALLRAGHGAQAGELVAEFKKIYSLSTIVKQTIGFAKELEIYWLGDDDGPRIGNNNVIWCWAPSSDDEKQPSIS